MNMNSLRNKLFILAIIAVSLISSAVTQSASSQTPAAQASPPLLLAQDFQRNAPPGSNVPLPTNTAPPGGSSISPRAGEQALNANLGQLKGIVILGSYPDFKPEGVGGIQGLDIEGPAFLKDHKAMVSVWMNDFLGKPLTLTALDRLQVALIRVCRQLDRPVVDVYYPQQEIIDGVVQIVIYEGKVGQVNVIHLGGKWFNDAYLTNHIHLTPGSSISQEQLLHDLDRLNRDTQFLEVSAAYKQAKFSETNSGSTDIDLTAKERFPLRVFAGYDNYGLKVLGENQMFGGFNYGNLFGVADQLNYQYTTDIQLSYLQAHTASFIDPLPWGHTLMIFGGYNSVNARLSNLGLPNSLNNNGYTYQTSLRYIVPLPRVTVPESLAWLLDLGSYLAGGDVELQHDISIGYDFKSADTALVYGKISVTPFAADIDQFALGYRALLRDRIGYSTLNLNGYYSPGEFMGRNNDTDFSSFHPGLKANYYYGRAEGERVFNLPWGLWLRGRGGYQNSSTGLLPSEQLYMGGYAMLRGYPEDIVSGDQGYYASVELHSPLIRTSNLTGQKNLPGQPDGDILDIFGFYDYGAVDRIRPDTSSYVSLDSAGAGLSYHVSQNLKVDFSYGFQLEHLPPSTLPALSKDHSRAHISATLAF
jgi:hemolysin activation/secretion protein